MNVSVFAGKHVLMWIAKKLFSAENVQYVIIVKIAQAYAGKIVLTRIVKKSSIAEYVAIV